MKPQINDIRVQLLELLAEHRTLTTGQLHREVRNDDVRRNTWRDLAQLRKLELVKAFPLEPEKGTAAEFYWQLTRKGAAEISAAFVEKIPTPTPQQILYKTAQLDLEREIKKASWLVEKPRRYSLNRPKPLDTPQREAVIKALLIQQQAAQPGNQANNAANHIRLSVPASINDYVAIAPRYAKTLVFILCPPDAGRKFWEGRAALYAGMAERFGIISAIFTNPEQRSDQLEAFLGEYRIEILELAGVFQKLKTV